MAIYPRRITFLMTEIYYDLPLLGLYFRASAARPVREAGPSVSGLKAALAALRANETICLFPEGGITEDGRLQPGRRGVARLAARTGAPVLPIGIRGAIRVLSKVQRSPRLHPVEIRIGEPLRYEGEDSREGEESFTRELMSRIGRLAYD
jgi:1-acyl-sn-glycerol-3-phosphate acyltransferase